MLRRRVGQRSIPPSAHFLLHCLPIDGELVPGATLRFAMRVARVNECAVARLLIRFGAGHDRLKVSDVLVHLGHLRGVALLGIAGAVMTASKLSNAWTAKSRRACPVSASPLSRSLGTRRNATNGLGPFTGRVGSCCDSRCQSFVTHNIPPPLNSNEACGGSHNITLARVPIVPGYRYPIQIRGSYSVMIITDVINLP